MRLIGFLLAHVIGDFYLQTSRMAQTKRVRMPALILHSLLYGLCIFFVTLLHGTPAQLIGFFIAAAGSHFLLDWLKTRLEKENGLMWFLLDQLIHIGVLVILASRLSALNPFGQAVKAFLEESMIQGVSAQWSIRGVVLASLAYAALWTPASVLVKHVLIHMEGKKGKREEALQEEVLRAGEMIGKLERIIVLTLCLLNAAASIAFVLTAKSIARYKQLEDQCFAERYLVGTLLSVALALMCYLVYKALSGV
ncbi:MAG TPA: DUF3307 domain-containing protein [Feifaniaceae bacterium]|nr:DUF3307 domain-containing protein [Feifaniaceae bacterium]